MAGNLVFNDDFGLAAGIQPNTSTWSYNTGTDPNNTNVQYTDTASTLHVVDDPGATDGKALALTLSKDPNNANKFLSARINTTVDPLAGNWQYGHVEARIKMPGGPNGQGVGIWPAFWMLGTNINTVGWPNCGEIDIMENKGSTPGTIQGTIHGPGYSGGGGITAGYTLPGAQNFYDAYHVFAVDWSADWIHFLVDGHLYASRTPANLPGGTSWAFNHPFYIILNVADGGSFAGPPGPNSTFPQTMLVDYVRAATFPLSAAPPLLDADIGAPALAGGSNFDGVKWTVSGGGTDIWGTSDQFHFASQSFTGDVSITARVDNLSNSGTYAKTGIMIRDGSAANASYAFAFVTPNTGAAAQGANFEYRNGAGTASQGAGSAPAVTAPQWLRLVRSGNNFTAYYSADGVSWTQNGATINIPMGAAIKVGLAVSANSGTALNTAMYRSVSILPGGWSDADIDAPGTAGAAAYDPSSATWTVNGGGSDIWNAADQFHFAHQTLSGNGNVVARVTSLANTNAWAKAGVMLRNDETAGSAFANINVTAGNGVSFQWRATAGATAASTTIAGLTAPFWDKLTRFGNSFSGFYSTDGITWMQIGTSHAVTMNAVALAGLAVTAHDNAALNGATFSNVTVQPTAVVDHHLFYNNSYWTNPANGFTNDDAAIDTSKTPLFNGDTGSFANYSGSSKGLNGIMIDIAGLPTGTPAATDFTFKVGNDSTPSGWATGPDPVTILVRRGAGTGGSDRIELIWPDNAIQNTWLQVTVKSNTATGLATADIFYFGNAIAETGNNPLNASVNSGDIIAVRDHPTSSQNPALVSNPYDFNHDSSVSSADMIIARDHPSSSSTELHLIAPTMLGAAAPSSAVTSAALAVPLSSTQNSQQVQPTAPAPIVFAFRCRRLRLERAHGTAAPSAWAAAPMGDLHTEVAFVDAASHFWLYRLGGRHIIKNALPALFWS